ncbi:unnamed protein product [Camellia sinensis]
MRYRLRELYPLKFESQTSFFFNLLFFFFKKKKKERGKKWIDNEPVIQLVVLHVGFIFQYKKKQKKLEVEIKNLEEQRKQIEEKVDEAITRGEEVDEHVSNWLAEVEERVQKIKDDNTINENM